MSLVSLARPLAKVRRDPDPEPGFRTVVPDAVSIPLEYPGRILFHPLVKTGDTVARGQIIGRSDLGNCMHASVSGTVRDIVSLWTHQSVHVPALVIDRDPAADQTTRRVPDPAGELRLELFRACGVIAPFTVPGHGFREEPVDDLPEVSHIIVQGVHEEPSLFADEQLLHEFRDDVQTGLRRATTLQPRARMMLTVIDRDIDWANEQFGELAEIVPLPDDYRARLERILIPRLTDKKIPHTHSFRHHGVIVMSVEALLDATRALESGLPVVDKRVTVAGYGLERPVSVSIPLGTAIIDVLTTLEIDAHQPDRILVGGPMQGYAQFSLDTPLSKFAHGIVLLGPGECPGQEDLTCVNCGRCVRACPARLQVNLIGRHVEFGQHAEALRLHAEACIGCGLCSFVCPAHRPLRQLVGLALQPKE